MGLIPKFTKKDVDAGFKELESRILYALINRMYRVGEETVNMARGGGKYLNQTGNLRNSIGYVLYDKGVQKIINFQKTADGKIPTEENALEIGKTFAESIAKGLANADNIVLVVVAGMEYATHVESRNLDVLTSAEQYCAQRVPQMLEQLKANVMTALTT